MGVTMFRGILQSAEDIADLLARESYATYARIPMGERMLLALREEDGSITGYDCIILRKRTRPAPDAKPPALTLGGGTP